VSLPRGPAVGLASAVALLLAHCSHLGRVEQAHHQLATIAQVADQGLVVVPGRLDADDHDLGPEPAPCRGD
jgi:hypothetical protein